MAPALFDCVTLPGHSTMKAMDNSPKHIALWLWWRVLGNRIAYAALFLQGHGRAWRGRYRDLKAEGLADGAEALLCCASAVIGVGLSFVPTHAPLAENLLAFRLDHYIHYVLGGLVAHRVFGVLLAAAGLLGLVGVMEWPSQVLRGARGDLTLPLGEWERNNLRVLLLLRRTGSLLAFAYWSLAALLVLLYSPRSSLGLMLGFAALMHQMAYFWAGRQYARGWHRARGRMVPARRRRVAEL